MDENLSRGYVQLGKARGINEFKFNSNNLNEMTPPVDKYNLVYFAGVLAGVGFLLPYNSFVIAVDYFQARYPGTTVIFDMSVVYITMAFFAVCANNILVESVSLNTRIGFGYLISLLTLNFVVISEIWWELFGVATSYTINLIAVAVVSLGCTVQQSSFYGYTSMLPSRYTQAVMAGESVAGFWVSMNRILTKYLIDDVRGNTSMFFMISIVIISTCSVLYRLVRKTEFVQFYVNLCQERNKITLEPTEDIGLMDPLADQIIDNSSTKGTSSAIATTTVTITPKLKLKTSMNNNLNTTIEEPNYSSSFSFSNPVYEPNAPSGNSCLATGPTYKVEDVIVMRNGSNLGSRTNRKTMWSVIKRGFFARLQVAKVIAPYMSSIAIAYFVTLCLYPGIVSEIISCKFESWMPVILMAAFNGADLLGKILASIPYEWSKAQLLYLSTFRLLLIPLFLLCSIPRKNPIFSGEGYSLLFSWLLGLSNGIVGSVPMIQAPSKVPEEHRELVGNIMTFSYTTGLTLGSFAAYILDYFLGAPMTAKQICPKIPKIITSTTTAAATLITDSNITSSTTNTTLIGTIITSTLSTIIKKATSKKKLALLTTTTVVPFLHNSLYNNSTTLIPNIIVSNATSISNSIFQN